MINESELRAVAIIGSGLAGLTAAILLRQQGYEPTLFEKSRGPGGRLAAKRIEGGSVDVGAQYFTIRNPEFQRFLDTHAGADSYARWKGSFAYQTSGGHWEPFPNENRYVGLPRMTGISRALSENLDLRTQTRIQSLEPVSTGWNLVSTNNEHFGPFERVVITVPPAQARDLLEASHLPHLASHLTQPVQHVQPCWALAAHFPESPFKRFDGMRVRSDILSWVANNSSKPGREIAGDGAGQWWVLHATSAWSHTNQDLPPEQAAGEMVREFLEITGSDRHPDDLVTHRWLYAKSTDTQTPGHFWFAQDRIGLAGDWLGGGRVEGAFNSAAGLVQAMEDQKT